MLEEHGEIKLNYIGGDLVLIRGINLEKAPDMMNSKEENVMSCFM